MTAGPAGGGGDERRHRRGGAPPRSLRDRARVDDLVAHMPSGVALPRRNGELVFDAPWESRAFGMAVALHQAGLFEWAEFQQRLIDEIAAWERDHDDRSSWSYYACWMRAFESVLAQRGICSPDELAETFAHVLAESGHDDHH